MSLQQVSFRGRPVHVVPRVLDIDQPGGQVTKRTNQASVDSEVYRLTVPRGQAYFLDWTKPFLFVPLVKETHADSGVGNQTFTTTFSVAKIIKPDATAYAAGVWQQVFRADTGASLNIVSINDDETAGADNIVYSTSGVAQTNTVYYATADIGSIIVRVEDPRGSGRLQYPVFIYDNRLIVKGNLFTNQAANPLNFSDEDGSPLPVLEDWDIVIYINATWTLGTWLAPVTSANNAALVRIPILQARAAHLPANVENYVRDRLVRLAR